jgi:hypothetical protein
MREAFMRLFRRRDRRQADEYERRRALPPVELEQELSAWLERHPEMLTEGRVAQIAAWLRATD